MSLTKTTILLSTWLRTQVTRKQSISCSKLAPDPNAHCHDGDTPLHRSLRNIAIADVLLQAGRSNAARRWWRNSPCTLAASLNLDSAIPFLLRQGAEIDKQDIDGDTPLHDALRKGNTQAVLVLFRNGADHLIENDRRLTPLELGHDAGQLRPCASCNAGDRDAVTPTLHTPAIWVASSC